MWSELSLNMRVFLFYGSKINIFGFRLKKEMSIYQPVLWKNLHFSIFSDIKGARCLFGEEIQTPNTINEVIIPNSEVFICLKKC